MTLAPGVRLGPYAVIGPLGSGGMGEVYRARDDRLGREVAVKVLRSDVATDTDRLRRFEQEARAAGALNHPQLLTVFDTGVHDGAPYLVFELLEGETLRQRLAAGPLAARRAVELAAGIADGLAAAHEKGIVHRDLKPENVFVTKEGRPKILDFGLAKLRPDPDPVASDLTTLSGATAPGTVVGTLAYMSPEQLQGHKVDHRTDIFSLGLVLYEMLSGRRPFQRDTLEATVTAVLTQDPPPLVLEASDSAAALERILESCLQKRPETRFQSAHDLAFALRALPFSGATSVQARQGSVPVAGRKLWLGAVLAALLLAALGAGVWFGRSTAPSPQVAYQRLTFRRGTIRSARFAPDGQTVVYAAAWGGEPVRVFTSRIGRPEFTSLALPPANLLAVSASGEMALALAPRWLVGQWPVRGTLARAPLAGGAPREILQEVDWADWAPDGGSLAVVHAVGGKVRLEYPIGKVLYETDDWISHARTSPGGDRVAYIDHPTGGDDAGAVVVVDRSGQKTTLSAGWSSVQGLAWHPAGREVWFTAAKAGMASRLWAVTLSGRERLIAQAPARLALHDISVTGRLLLTRETIHTDVIGLALGQARERDYSLFDGTRVTDLSPDGTTMLLDEVGEVGGPEYSVYLRKMDGSPAVRLGEGGKGCFSPDRKWALSVLPRELVLLPTGPGEEKRLDRHGIGEYQVARWFPDGARVVFAGNEPGHGPRLYVQEVAGGGPRSLTPQGVGLPAQLSNPVSPDGTWVTGLRADRKLVLYSVENGTAQELRALEPADEPILWARYGRVMYVLQAEGLPARVYRLDLQTGQRDLWKQVLPPDPAGVNAFGTFVLTPDARSAFAYSTFRIFSELYVGELK